MSKEDKISRNVVLGSLIILVILILIIQWIWKKKQ